jgi:DNA-binding CsgD family transcriptional regulator
LGVEERWARASHAAAAAELAIWRHEPESALQHASTELHLTDPPLDRVYLLRWCLWALGDLADLARRRGNSAARDDAAARARQLMDDYGVGVTTATGSPQLRALAQAEYARATTGSDAQLWLGVVEMTPDRPYDQAYSLYRRAEALADAGLDHGAAGAAATDAQQLARDLGAAPLLDSIDALITRTNLTVAATPNQVAGTAASPVLLTARELQVLAQLRCGMSNRRIGRALNISEKTASVHVSNILGKLGVGNRTAAAAVAHQLGL